MRVVSLVPSATEALIAMGAAHFLVGRSEACDDPGGPVEIVNAFDSTEAVKCLRPDLLIHAKEASRIPSSTCRQLILGATSIEGMLDEVLALGDAVNLAGAALKTVVAFREKIAAISDRVNPFVDGPRTVLLDQIKPIRVAGTWKAQLVERAGATHVLNPCIPITGSGDGAGGQGAFRAAGPPRPMTVDEISRQRPQLILVCVDADTEGRIDVRNQDVINELHGVSGSRVEILDGTTTLCRLSLGITKDLETLMEVVALPCQNTNI